MQNIVKRKTRHATAASLGLGKDKVIAHRQLAKQMPPFQHYRDTVTGAFMGGAAGKIRAVLQNGSGGRSNQAANRANQRRFAGAIGADDRDTFATRHAEADIPQHRQFAIARGKIFYLEDWMMHVRFLDTLRARERLPVAPPWSPWQ